MIEICFIELTIKIVNVKYCQFNNNQRKQATLLPISSSLRARKAETKGRTWLVLIGYDGNIFKILHIYMMWNVILIANERLIT